MIISIIPARGGSKGIPKKNIVDFYGHPLVSYSIAASILSSRIQRTIVSTDSEEIAEIAKRYGADVPFLRPKEISGDLSLDIEFVEHTLEYLYSVEHPEIIIHLRPTTPIRVPETIDFAIDTFIGSDATALRSVHRFSYFPQKLFFIKNGRLQGLFPGDERTEYYNLPRQLLEPAYYPNGYVDILRSSVVNTGVLHGDNIIPFVVTKTEDIDSIEQINSIPKEAIDSRISRYLDQKVGII